MKARSNKVIVLLLWFLALYLTLSQTSLKLIYQQLGNNIIAHIFHCFVCYRLQFAGTKLIKTWSCLAISSSSNSPSI